MLFNTILNAILYIMRTLLLDTEDWDLCLNSAGQIQVAGIEYSIAQNVANAIRLFTKDAWFDPDRGIPHFDVDLSQPVNIPLIRNQMLQKALAVEGVADAEVEIYGVTDRELTGRILLTLTTGAKADVDF